MSRLAAIAAATLLASPVFAQIEAQPGLRDIEEQNKEQQQQRQPRLTKAPRLIHQVPVIFPESARAEKRQGAVVLRITIDDEGYVQRVDVLQSAGEDLDWAAMGAVANFVFEPAEVDDVPAAIQIDYRQNFILKEEVHKVPIEPPLPPPPEPVDAGMGEPVEEPAEPLLPVNFRGIVRESGTKRPIADAELAVMLDDESYATAITLNDGRFELHGVPDGERMVRISATEYEALITVEEFSQDEMVEATYFLPRRSYNKFETIVRDRRPTKEVNRVQLRREEVSQVAGTFGDPLRVIENLPGMARAPLIGGQLLVRGASPQSSGVYMDGIQIPLLYHFGGLTSVINAEFLEDIDFYPGGFGARYGRATAGIVDVKTRELRFRDYRGFAKIDMFDSGFFFGGPVTLWGDPVDSEAPNPRRLSFALAGRRSYIDALIPLALGLFLPAGAGAITIAPVYWDYQGKIEYRPLAAHTLQLFVFGSDDSLKVLAGGTASGEGLSAGIHQQFHRLVGRWEWRILPNLTNRFQTFVGLDKTDFGIEAGSAFGFGLDNRIRLFGVRNDVRYQLFEGLTLHGGMDYTVAVDRFESELPSFAGFGGGGGLFTVEFPRITGRPDAIFTPATEAIEEDRVQLNLAPYLEAEIGPFAGLKIIPGFRFDYFKYSSETRQFVPSPRLAITWEPIRGTILKAAYGVYTQPPATDTVSETFGRPDLLPERARHHILGFEQRLTPKISVAMNAYYNKRDQLISQSSRILGISGGAFDLERYNNQGIGNSYGVDLLLRHDLSKDFFGWIAYTLSRSEVRAKPGDTWRLFDYDQTHILTIVGQYKLPWHLPFREWSNTGRLPRGWLWNTGWALLAGDFSVGGRFRLVSGNPTTFYAGSYHDLDRDSWVAESNQPFTDRLPAFHQLDMRLDYKVAFDSWLLDFYVDFLNVYNRQNAEAMQWDYRYQKSTPLALLPFLPIAGMTAEF